MNQHSSQGQTIYTTVFIQPKFTVLYHLGLLKDAGGLPMMKSPNDTVLGTHPSVRDIGPHAGTESEKGDAAFSPWWACLCTEAALTCSPKDQGKGECETTLFREVTAKVTFYVLSISSQILQSRAQALSSEGSAQIPAFLTPIVKARLLAPSTAHGRAFLPCFVQTWGGSSSKPYAGHLHEPYLV